jgi:hypothetical protein
MYRVNPSVIYILPGDLVAVVSPLDFEESRGRQTDCLSGLITYHGSGKTS